MNKKLKEMREIELDVLVAELTNASQLGRSTRLKEKERVLLNNELLDSIKRLREKVDSETITNQDIRSEIYGLSKKTGVSIGQAQKVINVYLKVYCFLLNKSEEVLNKLDCPLDSTTMKSKNTMKGVKTIEEYEDFQGKFEKECGMRILKDLKYDNLRLNNFKKSGGKNGKSM